MLTITLNRTAREGKAVRGSIVIPFDQRQIYATDKAVTIQTLENADFIIPAGTYPLRRTYSPKFKKLLPLIDEVPDREGIRIHRGSIPEHSTGCVLVDMYGQACLDALFNRLNKFYDNEEITICIVDDLGADSGSGL